jgi:hypothetical protein
MTAYKEYKEALRRQKEQAQAIRNEVFSSKAEILAKDLVKISNGDVYKIIQKFGRKYKNSTIIKIKPENVQHQIDEAKKVRELAGIMASVK